MKKYCPRCGHKSTYKFCPKCGFDLQKIKVPEQKYCPKCGFKSDEDFCPKCGFNLKDIKLEENNSSISEVQFSAQNISHAQMNQNIKIQENITENQPECKNQETQQKSEMKTNTNVSPQQTTISMKEIPIPDRLYNLSTKGLERANELINATWCPISFLNAFISWIFLVGLILSSINVFISLQYFYDVSHIQSEQVSASILNLGQLSIGIISYTLLRKYHYTGYILFFVSRYIGFILSKFDNLATELVYFTLFLIINIIYTIYFEKRRFLFTEKAEFPIFKAKSKYNIKVFATQEMKMRILLLSLGFCSIYVFQILSSLKILR